MAPGITLLGLLVKHNTGIIATNGSHSYLNGISFVRPFVRSFVRSSVRPFVRPKMCNENEHGDPHSFHPSIRFQVDRSVPLPIVDLLIVNNPADNTLLTEFFRKPNSNPVPFPPSSGVPARDFSNYVSTEVMRILSRCSIRSRAEFHLRDFENRLLCAGFGPGMVIAAMRRGRSRYVGIDRDVLAGLRPRYRSRAWRLEFLKKPITAPGDPVWACPYSGEPLCRDLQAVTRRTKVPIQLLPRRGRTLGSKLCKRPFAPSTVCQPHALCKICRLVYPERFRKPRCDTKNVVYALRCSHCEAFYIGVTSRPLRIRYRKHTCASRLMLPSSVLSVHQRTAHPEVNISWYPEILAHSSGWVRSRILEALMIRELRPSLNVQMPNHGGANLHF